MVSVTEGIKGCLTFLVKAATRRNGGHHQDLFLPPEIGPTEARVLPLAIAHPPSQPWC